MTHSHFAFGLVNPLMGFGFALAGSFLGLTCMVHARQLPPGPRRRRWLMFASLAIGGTGIWMMHFIAMIGFTVSAGDVKYDLAITAASLVTSIVSVAIGIFIVGAGKQSTFKVFIGGPITGLGVVAMHYAGMAAMNIAGTIHYDPTFVTASVIIAIVAATVALYFAISVSGRAALLLASVTMAIAVCGMHYTGMYAISVELTESPTSGPVPGVDPLMLLIPILVLATGVLIALIVGVLGERDEVAPVQRKNPTIKDEPAAQEPNHAVSSLWTAENEQPAPSDAHHSSPARTPMLSAKLAERRSRPSAADQSPEEDSTSVWAASLRANGEDTAEELRH